MAPRVNWKGFLRLAMNRFALLALMMVTVFDCANAARIQAPPGIPECHDDARKFCDAVVV